MIEWSEAYFDLICIILAEGIMDNSNVIVTSNE